MTHRIIFVGGVHGVGKTHFCQKLTEKFDVEHVTARRHIALSKSKDVEDVKVNQSILVTELSCYPTKKSTLLLDGHFSLLTKTSEMEDVPLSTFQAISPLAIVLLKDDPSEISIRISQRDGEVPKVGLIAALQEREISRANLVSSALNIQLVIVEPQNSFEDSVKALIPYLD